MKNRLLIMPVILMITGCVKSLNSNGSYVVESASIIEVGSMLPFDSTSNIFSDNSFNTVSGYSYLESSGYWSSSINSGSVSSGSIEPWHISEAALASAQGAVKFEGTFTRTYIEYDDETEEYGAVSVFEENKYYNLETFDGVITYEANLKNISGTAYSVYLDSTNTVVEENAEVSWENFVNPFVNLETTDFVYSSSGKYDVTGTAAKEIAYAAYGYYVNMDTLTVTVVNDKITEIAFFSAVYTDSYYEEDVTDFGVFTVKEHGTAKVPVVTAFETVAEHANLSTALSSISNVTAELVSSSDYGDTTSTMKFTNEVILIEGAIDDDGTIGEYGYFSHGNNDLLYAFDIVEGEPVVYDYLEEVTLADASIDFSETIVEFFEFKGNGLFVAYEGFESFAVLGLLNPLFYGIDAVTAISIQLDGENNLESISYDYAIDLLWGMIFEYGSAVITFSDVDTTVVSYDFSDVHAQLDLIDQIPEEMFGTWFTILVEEDDEFYGEIIISKIGIHAVAYINGELDVASTMTITEVTGFNIKCDDGDIFLDITYDEDSNTIIDDEENVFDFNPIPGSTYITEPVTAIINSIIGEDIVINIDFSDNGYFVYIDETYAANGYYGALVYFVTDDAENVLANIEAQIIDAGGDWTFAEEGFAYFGSWYYVEFYEYLDGVVFYIY